MSQPQQKPMYTNIHWNISESDYNVQEEIMDEEAEDDGMTLLDIVTEEMIEIIHQEQFRYPVSKPDTMSQFNSHTEGGSPNMV